LAVANQKVSTVDRSVTVYRRQSSRPSGVSRLSSLIAFRSTGNDACA
jgi:hypothetical protein